MKPTIVKKFCRVFGDIAQFDHHVIAQNAQKLSFLKMTKSYKSVKKVTKCNKVQIIRVIWAINVTIL